MHARNAVAQRDHRADLIHLDALLVVLNLLAEQRGYLVRVDLCHVFPALDPALSLSPDFILKSCVSNPITLCVHQLLFELLQLAAHRSVIDGRSDLHYRAAEKRGVFRVTGANALPGQLRDLRL